MTVESTMTMLSQCAMGQSPDFTVALYKGNRIDSREFSHDVASNATIFEQQSEVHYALYFEEAYPFAVMLFALWYAGKSVWIAANNRPATADKLVEQGCRLVGDWSVSLDQSFDSSAGAKTLTELDSAQSTLTLFTSGSTGQPQAIKKALWQLQAEVNALESLWGSDLIDAQVLATVSHQHIYGLLFKILWPLSSRRCFFSQIFFTPESLLNASLGKSSCWVASPAQLKRLDDLTAWSEVSQLKIIFSSGGGLDDEAVGQIYQRCKPKLLDIYGSSETGGIAWRNPMEDSRWQFFPGVSLTPYEGKTNFLQSPYLPKSERYQLNDKLELLPDGRFTLIGRNDRIVKIEEKRLSLTEMEQTLQKSAWVNLAHCRLWDGKRARVACVIALNAAGKDYLISNGRQSIIKQLREQLLNIFEAVVLPKKWLFMDQLITSQAKIDHQILDHLLSLDHHKLPQFNYISQQQDLVELSIKIQADLPYFKGHFPSFPILPGVTQLAWAEQLGKIFFPITQPFSRMEAIKFKKIIQPNEKLTLFLRWNGDSGKLYFDFSNTLEAYSSGRLVYGVVT